MQLLPPAATEEAESVTFVDSEYSREKRGHSRLRDDRLDIGRIACTSIRAMLRRIVNRHRDAIRSVREPVLRGAPPGPRCSQMP